MAPKARVQKRLYYKIGEACKALDIQPYVLRYWETEFPALSPNQSRSGQRVYSEAEIDVIRRIKELLYEEGYTIAGAKKKLEAELANGGPLRAASEAPEPGSEPASEAQPRFDEPELAASATVLTDDPPAPPAPMDATLFGEALLPLSAAASPIVSPPAATTELPAPLLDTRAAERIQSMRQGIQEALEEARGLLVLLDNGSPSRR